MRLILALVGLLVTNSEASLTKYVYVCDETTLSTYMQTASVAAIESNTTAKVSASATASPSSSTVLMVGAFSSSGSSIRCSGGSNSTATEAKATSISGGDFYQTVTATVSPIYATNSASASATASSSSSSQPIVVISTSSSSSSSVSSAVASSTTSTTSTTAIAVVSSTSTTSSSTSSTSSSSTSSIEPTATPFTPTPNAAYLAVAKSAITALTGTFSTTNLQWTGVTGWIAANAYNDIMEFDRYTGGKIYETTYGAALLQIATSPVLQGVVLSTDAFNDDQLWWCMSMLRAYKNYGHAELLTQTITQWNQITESSFLTAADQGTTPSKGGIVRSLAIPATCDVDGGVYWAQTSDSFVNAISTGLYAEVSAWLFDMTKDAKYKTAADKSLGWLQRVMLDPKNGIMTVDSMNPVGCVKNPGSLTYNTGVYIGALKSLYSTTLSDTYLTPLLLSLRTSSTGFFGNTPTLVISQQDDLTTPGDATQWRDILFRNMIEGYILLAEKGISATIQSEIKAFFLANYNQIQSKAKFGDLYAANWFGLITEGSDWGTASVLSCLIGMMMMG